jgi:hypothetical protein
MSQESQMSQDSQELLCILGILLRFLTIITKRRATNPAIPTGQNGIFVGNEHVRFARRWQLGVIGCSSGYRIAQAC